MSNYNPIYIPGRKERERESEARRNAHHTRIEPQPTDPGPGVADVENLHRLATQAPEAPIPLDPSALDPIDVTMLDLENRAKAEMRRRDAVEANLKAEVDWWAERLFLAWKREERLKRTINQLVWIFGPVICALFWLSVWLGWHHVWPWLVELWRIL